MLCLYQLTAASRQQGGSTKASAWDSQIISQDAEALSARVYGDKTEVELRTLCLHGPETTESRSRSQHTSNASFMLAALVAVLASRHNPMTYEHYSSQGAAVLRPVYTVPADVSKTGAAMPA